MNAIKLEKVLTNENIELDRREKIALMARQAREAQEALEREVKAAQPAVDGVNRKLVTAQKGTTGFTIHGLSKPQFFYKEHAKVLFGDSPEAAKVREKIMAWIAENDAKLSNRE